MGWEGCTVRNKMIPSVSEVSFKGVRVFLCVCVCAWGCMILCGVGAEPLLGERRAEFPPLADVFPVMKPPDCNSGREPV